MTYLFDLDGTLIDSVPDLASSINFMLKSLNKETFSEDKIRSWVGNGATILVKRALSNGTMQNIDEEEFQKGFEIFMNHYQNNLCNETYLYPNVKELLEKIKNQNLAIITNKPYKFVKPILEELGIRNYFKLIYGADSLSEKKPSALPLIKACEYFNTNKAIMIGDSKNDIIAAKNANIPSIAVTYGYNYGEDIRKYNPDFIIDDILKVLECVK